MDRYREMLEIQREEEWKVVQSRIEKVTEARRSLGGRGMGFQGMGGEFGPGFGRPPGAMGPGSPGEPGGSGDAGGPGGSRNTGGPGGVPRSSAPEMEALQKAIDNKASKQEIKTLLTRCESRAKPSKPRSKRPKPSCKLFYQPAKRQWRCWWACLTRSLKL